MPTAAAGVPGYTPRLWLLYPSAGVTRSALARVEQPLFSGYGLPYPIIRRLRGLRRPSERSSGVRVVMCLIYP